MSFPQRLFSSLVCDTTHPQPSARQRNDNQLTIKSPDNAHTQVVRISPEGKVDTVVELPVKSPTSCTLGGPGLSTLFITTRGPDGGGLFSVELPAGMRGVEEPVFNDIPPPPGHYADHHASTGAAGAARFCSMCGASFSFGGAKFCSQCGCKRV